MAYFMGVMFVLACLTTGWVGAGVLALVVCAEGCRRHTLQPIRQARRAKAELIARCAHVWGEVWEVGHKTNFGPAAGMRFFMRSCTKCPATKHTYEDGSDYQPGHHTKPE